VQQDGKGPKVGSAASFGRHLLFVPLDAAAPLLYTDESKDSMFLHSLPKDVRKSLQYVPIAMENHGRGECFAADGVQNSHELSNMMQKRQMAGDLICWRQGGWMCWICPLLLGACFLKLALLPHWRIAT
jgi:hypothetical protein